MSSRKLTAILVYHKVELKRELGITRVSPERFRRQMETLLSEGFTSISPHRLVDHLRRGSPLPSRSALITFDDGYEGVHRFAYPVLKRYGLKAIVFLISAFLGRENSWDASICGRFKHLSIRQIREMAGYGLEFGSHGVCHLFLDSAPALLRRAEIELSRLSLTRKLRLPIRFFSSPYGCWNEPIRKEVRKAGYEAAFTMNPFLPLSPENLFSLPRISIYSFDNDITFRAKLGLEGKILRWAAFKLNLIANRCSHLNRLRVGMR